MLPGPRPRDCGAVDLVDYSLLGPCQRSRRAPQRSIESYSGATRGSGSAPRALETTSTSTSSTTRLFNVVEDPLERANLRERYKDVYDRIVAEWNAWNALMLPEIAESFSHSLTGEELADHYGAQEPSGAPDPTLPLPHAPQSR
jgi:hypothetical protein